MREQLATWEGDFGTSYTQRNVVDYRTRIPAFRKMLDGLDIHRVLEIGCNRGHNLIAINEIFGEGVDLAGIEPNPAAITLARISTTTIEQIELFRGDVFDIQFGNNHFDLVFTAGVLIHIAPDDLGAAIDEIYRVSSKYILVIEYDADIETPINYRGHVDLLWKRNFLKEYMTRFPGLRFIKGGLWQHEDGFDNTNWCLLQKGLQ